MIFYQYSFYVGDQNTARYCFFSVQEKCVSLAEPYATELIQFARIPVEFVVRFIRFQNRVKVIAFPIASEYIFESCSQRAFLSQYHWDEVFHFPGKSHFLVKTITDSVRLVVVYLNLVLSTANGILFCDCRPTMTSPRSTIYLKFILNEYNVNLFYCNCQ